MLRLTALGHILVGAAMHQAERWIQQWDSIQSTNRMSTPADSNEEKWRQGLWARQQLIEQWHVSVARRGVGWAARAAVRLWLPESHEGGPLGPTDTTEEVWEK